MVHSMLEECRGESSLYSRGLLNSRFSSLAHNTIDYWMVPDEQGLSLNDIESVLVNTKTDKDSSVSLYLHVPFCAQSCNFCAFSGGNSVQFKKESEKYAVLLSEQLITQINRLNLKDHKIRAVNIGGGSPNLLYGHIGRVLRTVRDLPGVTDKTEISVECEMSTTTQEFINQLVEYEVTKLSFGIQTLNETVRSYLQGPKVLSHVGKVLGWVKDRIPVINADLMTCLPGQNLADVDKDIKSLIEHPQINAISTYLLTLGAAPALVAKIASGHIPKQASSEEQAYMRLHSYATLRQYGWVRRGTNSYYDASIPDYHLEKIAGDECIGTTKYGDVLLGVGAQAISYLPGARIENIVELNEWTAAVEKGDLPFYTSKCSFAKQQDMALWLFPLRWEGLPYQQYESMLQQGVLDNKQIDTLREFINEGLIIEGMDGFELSIVGEVFMGHLVHGLKNVSSQKVIDEYIKEGFNLGKSATGIQSMKHKEKNQLNNRQKMTEDLMG